ncbi:hypothetical protein DPEC_G00206310 [Dallia pectoralis]|uniref:Uncharacterized protein n=1 Tax=Dallia pectoralis TaxID=75939 RepID=A0ACC2G4A1_DALPE|nr:hypothetical protein DPEC_G00206310 [Dallia pectoralis]
MMRQTLSGRYNSIPPVLSRQRHRHFSRPIARSTTDQALEHSAPPLLLSSAHSYHLTVSSPPCPRAFYASILPHLVPSCNPGKQLLNPDQRPNCLLIYRNEKLYIKICM